MLHIKDASESALNLQYALGSTAGRKTRIALVAVGEISPIGALDEARFSFLDDRL